MRKVLLIMTLLLTMVAQGAWADGTIDITPSDKNKVLCTDGSIYNNVSAAEADNKTPVAKIIVVDTENHKGLALALSDEGQMNYSNAQTACNNKTTSTPVTNATWAIPSKDEWDQMLSAAGSYTALRDGFSGIGGTNISNANQEVYWSRTKNTEAPNLVNWTYRFGDINSGWTSSDQGGTEVHVRFCLQFNLPIPTHNAALADGTPTGWSITPTTPEEGSTVTVSYTGQHRVKSVRVKKVAAGPKAAKDATAEDLGKVIGADGYIYADADAATAANTTAVAKIAYVGSDNGEADPYNHGLALALSDANGGSACYWSTSYTKIHTYNPTSDSFTSESGLQYKDVTHNSDTYPAFKAAFANNSTAAPTGCSDWFLASGYQWTKMFTAAGGAAYLQTTAPPYTGLQTDWYWSSTEFDADRAWGFNPNSASWSPNYKDDDDLVRSCLAF